MVQSKDPSDWFTRQRTFQRLAKVYAERSRSIVFVCGAGASSSAGLPLWDSFVGQLRGELTVPPYSSANAATLPTIIKEIENITDPWQAISTIKGRLGRAHFESAVRHILDVRDQIRSGTKRIPSFYYKIWDLNIKGLLNFNLDQIAELGFMHARPQSVVNSAVGIRAHENLSILRSSIPFIISAHGIIDEPGSWVLTKQDLESITKNQGYVQFIRNMFLNYSIVCYGISAEDFSVTGQLRYLQEIGIPGSDHFWLLRGVKQGDLQRASDSSLQIVALPEDKSWDDGLSTLIAALAGQKAVDTTPEPVFLAAPEPKDLLPPNEMMALEPDKIRTMLASIGPRFRDSDGSFNHKRYQDFCKEYDSVIHLASRLRLDTDNKFWLGYRATNELGRGVFGTVIRAERDDGTPLAIKMARDEVRDDVDMLNSFRRGVESMRYLTRQNFEGVVNLYDATELPPSIIMEYIEGADLEKVSDSGNLRDINRKLDLFLQICRIIQKCHQDERTILHRDLRPSNIMLVGEWWDEGISPSVKIIDFDLSWHFGANEKTFVTKGASALGYLAPEQLEKNARTSSRSALVDVYGLGMLLYYVLSGTHPVAGAAHDKDWESRIFSSITLNDFSKWPSARKRMARIVAQATSIQQSNRPMMDDFNNEISDLYEALQGNLPGRYALIAEDLLYRMFESVYDWTKPDRYCERSIVRGSQFSCTVNETQKYLEFLFSYAHTGDQERANIGKFIKGKLEKCRAILSKIGNGKSYFEENQGSLRVGLRQVKIESQENFLTTLDCLVRVKNELSLT